MMIKFHHNPFKALTEPATWAGIGGAVGVLGTQLDKPASTGCYVALCVCTIMATLVKQQVASVDIVHKEPDNGSTNNS